MHAMFISYSDWRTVLFCFQVLMCGKADCDRVTETLCHENMEDKTKEINLPRDAEETTVSQGRKDATP